MGFHITGEPGAIYERQKTLWRGAVISGRVILLEFQSSFLPKVGEARIRQGIAITSAIW